MNDQSDQDRPSAPPDPEVVASIPKGGADHELQPHPPAAGTTHQKAIASADDQLRRPRGALVAMRKSGGIRFTWRLVVVRGDGRVIYKSNELGAPRKARVIGQLEADQLADLEALIARSDFAAALPGAGRQNPDAFAYELIARVGGKNVSAEALEGSIPDGLKQLIQQLNRLLPRSDSAPEPAAENE